MAKKLNGTARWIIVALAVGGLIFNSGILYNHVQTLSQNVKELKVSYISLDEKVDQIMLKLMEKNNE